jgi:hypothetical protein
MHSANDPALMGVCAQLIWMGAIDVSLKVSLTTHVYPTITVNHSPVNHSPYSYFKGNT